MNGAQAAVIASRTFGKMLGLDNHDAAAVNRIRTPWISGSSYDTMLPFQFDH